jgi:hypothetical protein
MSTVMLLDGLSTQLSRILHEHVSKQASKTYGSPERGRETHAPNMASEDCFSSLHLGKIDC